jgi:hypothetical protein
MAFKVIWDNGHACGELAGGPFETEDAAEEFGENWRREMIAMDPDPKAAEEAYSFDVIEIEPETAPNDSDEEAAWYEELNRGYARDRI